MLARDRDVPRQCGAHDLAMRSWRVPPSMVSLGQGLMAWGADMGSWALCRWGGWAGTARFVGALGVLMQCIK